MIASDAPIRVELVGGPFDGGISEVSKLLVGMTVRVAGWCNLAEYQVGADWKAHFVRMIY